MAIREETVSTLSQSQFFNLNHRDEEEYMSSQYDDEEGKEEKKKKDLTRLWTLSSLSGKKRKKKE